MRRHPAFTVLLVAAGLLAACAKKEEDPCSVHNQKLATLDLVYDWYLYPELLPAVPDVNLFATPQALLDNLTTAARNAGKDRGWSYITNAAAQQAYYGEGITVGFGLNVLVRRDAGNVDHLFISQVYPGSAAAAAGLKRGDEIVAVGTADPLTPAATLIANDTLGDAFGPATVGLQRLFDVIPLGANPPTPVRVAMGKTTYGLDPVPAPKIWGTTGYVALRSFIGPADAGLVAAFTAFKAAGVTDVIVDLRYNGGGLLSTSELLANLLGGGLAGSTMYQLKFNPRHALTANAVAPFAAEPAAMTPTRIAFLVTGSSASASELVPNALAAWKTTSLALVGHQTYGKPVGQAGFSSLRCGTVWYLVSFKIVNKDGAGDYFGGLPTPTFPGCAVAADDDLTRETWDPAETQTAAALAWLASGTCPPPPAVGPLSVTGPVPVPDTYPEATAPTEAQRHIRGLF